MFEKNKNKATDAKIPNSQKPPFFLFRKKRGGVVLTKEQIREIRLGRKNLRREMREKGLKGRAEFNVMASSLNLYFDRGGKLALFKMFFLGKGGLLLLGAAILALVALWMVSWVTTMRGHFTINMSNDLFKEGFVLSESEDFSNPTTYLVCTPLDHVPEISISHIAEDVNQYDGMHSSSYFAYTYYLRNEGSSTVDYQWELALNSESQGVSEAVWVMVFEDDKMVFYAKEREDGSIEAIPSEEETGRGYLNPPMYQHALDPEGQYELVDPDARVPRWRVLPRPFESDSVVAKRTSENVAPGDVHKYTIVMWLEGDDPDCNNDIVGGHLGMEIYMSLVDEADDSSVSSEWRDTWNSFWNKIFG